MENKNWTGERLETDILNLNTTEHLHRYAIAQQFCERKIVLDIASGVGYGSNLLAQKAQKVFGIDISEKTIKDAMSNYTRPNLSFQIGSCSSIPLETHSVDLVVSFETIEHHDEHEAMMNEIKRVLKPDGLLLISSPDKKYYSDIPSYNNPFHIKELYFNEFKALIGKHFSHTDFYFQKITSGSMIIPDTALSGYTEYAGDYTTIIYDTDFKGVYNICLAGHSLLPKLNTSVFLNNHILDYAIKDAVERVQNSFSFKLGNILLSPFRLLKK